MKAENILMARRKGEIHIGKKATESLGISGWKWLGVRIEGDCVFMRICKSSPMEIGDHLIRLRDKSSGLRGACLKFTEKLDFGDNDSIDLQFAVMPTDSDECVSLKIIRPGFSADEDAGCEEKAEANEDENGKDDQVKVARWIRANGCAGISCYGTKGRGRFDGIACPLRSSRYGCGWMKSEEIKTAEDWLISNNYPLDQETSLGTISSPITEKQLDIFNLPGSKAGGAPRTRPLPEGLPEWLSGPLSRGEQVWVAIRVPGEKASQGWAIGIHSRFDRFSVAVADDAEFHTKVSLYHPKYIFQSQGTLKPAVECYKIAGKLGIGLSALQIEAVNSGGVPPEGHGLPDEMFE